MGVPPKRIAIFRIGHLGDTVASMPALWTIRQCFPDARITLLTQMNKPGVLAQSTDVLVPGIVYDDVLAYTVGGKEAKWRDVYRALIDLRLKRIDLLAYLPPVRTTEQIRRDRLFFKLAGVKRIVGMSGYLANNYQPKGKPLPTVCREADLLLGFLAKDGVCLKGDVVARTDIGLTPAERAFASDWIAAAGLSSNRRLIAVGAGSKMPAKVWPIENLSAALASLDRDFNLTFLFFGSQAEHEDCERALKEVKCGFNLAGEVSVRRSAALIERCDLYLGNDTGTMHLAAAGGVPCVALFSARDWPGRWFPFGEGHRIHRVPVPCEGCMLQVCDKDNLCLRSVEPEAVADSARSVLRSRACV
jgi:ADP-heptose:LPS heptosyltransferase